MSSRTTSLTGRCSNAGTANPGSELPTPSPGLSSSASPAHIEQLRQRLASGLQSHPELRDLLGLCAESNEWTVEEARQRPDSIVVMELFLLQVHRVPLLQYFPNLVTVKFMNIGLESTADFAALTHVEELWLSDNNIRVIEGLDKMTKLRRLYLQGNFITSLDGLPPLRHLRELWLSRNQLQRLTHLTPLRKLRALYAADNPIELLEEAFSKDMTHLHDVNLAGCHLADIAQLCYLKQLPCLRNVWFSDPLFGDNPICRMNNYTTLALAMLDSLDSLDGAYVTAEQRSLVESVLEKKKSYYEMRMQMLETHLVLLGRHAEACALREMAYNATALAQLHACLQPIEAELTERQLYCSSGNGESSSNDNNKVVGSLCQRAMDDTAPTTKRSMEVKDVDLENLRVQLAGAISTCEILEQQTLLRLSQATMAASAEAQLLKERLAVELHTAGNVRLEPVSPSSDFFTSVDELIHDRFQTELFERQFGITGVAVKRVRRFVNRGLRLRFDSRVRELHVDLANPQHRSRFVGLIGVVPTSREGQSACVQHALLRGVAADDSDAAVLQVTKAKKSGEISPYMPPPADEGVPLTDSLFYADEARLRAICENRGDVSNGNSWSSRSGDSVVCQGQLVLYRTYLGKAVSALGSTGGGAAQHNTATSSSFLQRAGRVLKRDYDAGITAAYRVLPTDAALGGGDLGKTAAGTTTTNKSYVWYCFDRSLVLADCVVDYEYTVTSALLSGPLSSASSLVAAAGACLPPLDPAAASALLSTVCMPDCGGPIAVNTGAKGSNSTAREKSGAGAVDVARDVRDDLLCCATPLLYFLHWCGCLPSEQRPSHTNSNSNNNHVHKHKTRPQDAECGGNTLKVVAVKECADAIAKVTAVLGDACTAELLKATRKTPSSDDKTVTVKCEEESGGAHPLQSRDVEDYVARMNINEGKLTLCVLRDLGITAIWKDFTCPLLATVTVLDLSQNALREFSWFAVAKEAPQLQRLNLRGNRLTSLYLDGSRLPALRTLDVSDNLLTGVEDFNAIRVAAPALEELEIRGNPLLTTQQQRQEAEARLWLYLAPPPSSDVAASPSATAVVKVSQRSIGTYPGTLAAQRYRRACLVAGGARFSSRTTRVLEFLVRCVKAISGAAGSAAAAALLSLDGATVPERYVNAVVAKLERWEAAGSLDESLADALRGTPQQQQPGSTDSPITRSSQDAFNVAAAETTGASPCFNECQNFTWCYGLLDNVAGLAVLMPNLCRVVLRGHALTNIDPLLQLSRLENLNVAENHIKSLPCLAGLKSLKELVVDFNDLTVLPEEVGPLPGLRLLSAAGNQITQVDLSLFLDGNGGSGGSNSANPTAETSKDNNAAPVPPTPKLEALHLAHNAIVDMNVIYGLREITSLLILSVMGNPCTLPDPTRILRREGDVKATGDDTRQYLIHVFPQLKVLDGGPISAAESARAREVYAGKINTDLLIEKAHVQPDAWAAVRNLNLSHCTLTEINLLEPFVGLEVLQLQHNLISLVTGLSTLTRLKALDLSHNRLGAAAWRSMNHPASSTNTTASGASSSASAPAAPSTAYVALGEALAPLKLLESLSIESNQLTDFTVLKLRLPKLKFLNARGNDLQFLHRGLEHLPDLRELLLDQNKLRGISADCFAENKKLSILSAESNGLKSLEGLRGCTRLEQLRLGANRLGELKAVFTDLQSCPLKSLVLIGNPVARKSNYRTTVVAYLTQLTELDRRPITQEDREKAATARVTEYVAPPNVVIDVDFLAAMGSPTGVSPPMGGGVGSGVVSGSGIGGVVSGSGGNGLPSRIRLSNPSAAIPAGLRRGGGGGGGGGGAGVGADRFNVNLRSRPYRR